jgi:hypothetical protein
MKTAQKYKTRVKVKLFMTGTMVQSYWVIEAKLASGWMMVGDDNGIMKFQTKKQAETAAKAFNS